MNARKPRPLPASVGGSAAAKRGRWWHALRRRVVNQHCDWNNAEEVVRFRTIMDEITTAYDDRALDTPDTTRLIEQTRAILAAVVSAPEAYRDMVQFAAERLLTGWTHIDDQWHTGALESIAPALARERAKHWRQHGDIKLYSRGPLVFAEIHFELSAGKRRIDAIRAMVRKYGDSQRQVENWYDRYNAELRDSTGFIPDHLTEAFITIALERALTVSAGLRMAREAFTRETAKNPR